MTLALVSDTSTDPHQQRVYRVHRKGRHLFNSMSLVAVEQTLQALYARPVAVNISSCYTENDIYYVNLDVL